MSVDERIRRKKAQFFVKNFLGISSFQIKIRVQQHYKSMKVFLLNVLIETVLKTSQDFAVVTVMKVNLWCCRTHVIRLSVAAGPACTREALLISSTYFLIWPIFQKCSGSCLLFCVPFVIPVMLLDDPLHKAPSSFRSQFVCTFKYFMRTFIPTCT